MFLCIFFFIHLSDRSFFIFLWTETTQRVPVVISCVRAIVTKSTRGILTHLVSMVMRWQATEVPSGALFKQGVPESVLAKVPKGWNYKSLDAGGKETASSKSMHEVAIAKSDFKVFLHKH